MSGTIVEKIFKEHLVSGSCDVGEIIECSVDLLMMHEMLGDQIARIFEQANLKHVWNQEKIVTILDHWVPSPSENVSIIHQTYRRFVSKHGIKNDLGMNNGICHVAVPELGFVKPGMLIIGSDSHTTTYGAVNAFSTGMGATDVTVILAKGKIWLRVPASVKIILKGNLMPLSTGKDVALFLLKNFGTSAFNYKAMEIHVQEPRSISMSGRFTIANMGVELGAKCAIFSPDVVMEEWLKEHGIQDYNLVDADVGANYEKIEEIHLDKIPPLIAEPPSPSNVKTVSECKDLKVDQVFIGSCTNGRLEDLELAARILGDHEISSSLRCIIIPASRRVYLDALKKGLIEKFVSAGAIVEYPTCGPCMGGHMGILGPDEICVSTTNRNFPGRMGSSIAKIYLASPATAMATAIRGKITDPREIQ
ncbi:MAG: 3-isopropylmalate dehydratase large subunit [Promethearchaeota archaeon]